MRVSSLEQLRLFHKTATDFKCKVIVTNGCFDLFHPGHLHMIKAARAQASIKAMLFVLVNSDKSVRALKGSDRPVQDEEIRAEMVDALKYVFVTYIFDSQRCDKELEVLKPDIYVKGDDRKLEDLDPAERAVLERHGTKIVLLPRLKDHSTTKIISKGK